MRAALMGGSRGRIRPRHTGSLALLTDLYELTMAQGYLRTGRARHEAVFHLSFRSAPFGSGFTIACGQGSLLQYLTTFRFDRDALDYLRSLTASGGGRLFDRPFLQELADLKLTVDVDAVPEGSVVFPHEPLVRVRGPLLQCQLLETLLLTIVNFQTLVATKAARVRLAAGDDPVLEIGLRRAHGVDGGVAASRAAYVGGCTATSNVLAGQRFGIPVDGTLGHSWIMAFESELDAFGAWAKTMPGAMVLLVDTYDTVQGVRHAIEVGRTLRAKGFDLAGVRLDSGDLVALSRRARGLLDDAGFAATRVVASGDLDEHRITAIKRAGARVDAWGVGTRLVTAHDEPALPGVYKLSAVRAGRRAWRYPLKRSEQVEKRSMPGILQVARFMRDGVFVGDGIFAEGESVGASADLIDVTSLARRFRLEGDGPPDRLLEPLLRAGRRVGRAPTAERSRERVRAQLDQLPPECLHLRGPAGYLVGVTARVHRLRGGRTVVPDRGARPSGSS